MIGSVYHHVIQGLSNSGGVEPLAEAVTSELPNPAGLVHHGMAQMLRDALPKDQPLGLTLKPALDAIARRSMAATAALVELSGALSRSGVRHLAFKGPMTAYRWYPRPELRPFLDLDVLVEENMLRDAIAVVESLGFQLDSRVDGRYRWISRAKHQSHLRGVVRVEVHSRLHHDHSIHARSSFDAYWHHKELVEVSGTQIPSLGPPDAVYHASMHGYGHAFLSFKWLADLALMARARPACEAALLLAHRTKQEDSFLAGFWWIANLGGQVPQSISKGLLSPAVRRKALGLQAYWGSSTRRSLLTHRLGMLNRREKGRAVFDLAFKATPRDWANLPSIPPEWRVFWSAFRIGRLAIVLPARGLRDLAGHAIGGGQ